MKSGSNTSADKEWGESHHTNMRAYHPHTRTEKYFLFTRLYCTTLTRQVINRTIDGYIVNSVFCWHKAKNARLLTPSLNNPSLTHFRLRLIPNKNTIGCCSQTQTTHFFFTRFKFQKVSVFLFLFFVCLFVITISNFFREIDVLRLRGPIKLAIFCYRTLTHLNDIFDKTPSLNYLK